MFHSILKFKKAIIACIVLLLVTCTSQVQAQCSVCRRAAETSNEAGEKTAKGLNKGILYLMAIPYLMGGVAGVIWWRNKKK